MLTKRSISIDTSINPTSGNELSLHEIKAILKEPASPPTPFILFDLDRLDQQIDLWLQNMPGVTPYFAIKACDEPSILEHMHGRGLCFDAATAASWIG